MDTLKLDAPLVTREPEVLLDPTLPVGRYLVSLVVTTDRGESVPATLQITVQRAIVRPPILEPVIEPVRPPVLEPVSPVVRPTPGTVVIGTTPGTTVIGTTPIREPGRPRKPRAKPPRPKKEE